MASTIKVDTIQSTTSNVFFQNSAGTEYARFDSTGVFQLANNLNFTGTAPRIIGDTNNATISNRLFFQSSTTNGSTTFGTLPNGTSLVSGYQAYNNSDPTNAAFIQIATSAGTEARVTSGITGTGTYVPMTFYTGGSERLRILAGAPILSLAGGSTTATGTGIAFPATQNASADANTLDDYEEGTFTPTFSPGAGAFTTASATGFYTKIGRFVNVYINFVITTIGTASGSLSFTGLPFANGAANRHANLVRENGTTGIMGQVWIDTSTITGVVRRYDDVNYTLASGQNYIITLNYYTT